LIPGTEATEARLTVHLFLPVMDGFHCLHRVIRFWILDRVTTGTMSRSRQGFRQGFSQNRSSLGVNRICIWIVVDLSIWQPIRLAPRYG